MKKLLVVMVCIVLAASAVFGEEKQALKTQKEKLSYAIGIDMGNSLKRNSIDIDGDILYKGIKDALAGGTQLLTEQEIRDELSALIRNKVPEIPLDL